MRNYQARHKKDNLDDKFSAGALSWYLLWTSPSKQQATRNYEKRFDVNVKWFV